MKTIFRIALGLLVLTGSSSAADKPNVILMVADDLGYQDLSCYGATKLATPRIDSLARDGARFTDAHSYSGICMPSRYAILSGRYGYRLTRPMDYACNFDPGQVLMPQLFREAGYRTAAIGKWHNGFGNQREVDWNAPLKPGPLEFGFDSFFGTPRTHSEPPLVFVRDHAILGFDPNDPISVDKSPGTGAHGKQIGGKKAMEQRPDEKIDMISADEAVKFITSKNTTQPFFLYLAWQAPHNPINPSGEFRGKSQAGIYGDYIQQLDHCVGVVLDALEKKDLARETIIVFTSDNGGRYLREALRKGHRCNGGLLGQKTDLWEGGHRVAMLARWPGRIPAGTVRQEYFHQVDLMATLADLAGAAMPAGASPDGASEKSAFLDPVKAPVKRTEGMHHGTRGLALRHRQWIYIPAQGSGGKTVPEPAKPWSIPYREMPNKTGDVDESGKIKPGAPKEQLYDLAKDLAQTTNLAATQADLLPDLRQRYAAFTAGVKLQKSGGGE